MTTQFPCKRLFMCFFALAFAWLLVVEPLARCIADEIDKLPLTEHARTAHAGQTWNAASIQTYIAKKYCTPKEYICANDTAVLTCQLRPGLSIGLVVGRTVRQIITGFAAPDWYWDGRCP